MSSQRRRDQINTIRQAGYDAASNSDGHSCVAHVPREYTSHHDIIHWRAGWDEYFEERRRGEAESAADEHFAMNELIETASTIEELRPALQYIMRALEAQ